MTGKGATSMAPRTSREVTAFDPFQQMQERLNRAFGEGFDPFFKGLPRENWSLSTWAPVCDIYETENEIVVKAELPEVKKENLKVAVENNVLTIHGERKFSEETKRDNYHRVERSYGEFMRSFTLPNFVDTAKINAEFKDGMLCIKLAKKEETKPKNVEVKVT